MFVSPDPTAHLLAVIYYPGLGSAALWRHIGSAFCEMIASSPGILWDDTQQHRCVPFTVPQSATSCHALPTIPAPSNLRFRKGRTRGRLGDSGLDDLSSFSRSMAHGNSASSLAYSAPLSSSQVPLRGVLAAMALT